MQDKMASEKRVSYSAQNTYSTFGNFSSKTKNVWLVFHGMGHLSRYFIRHFSTLNPEENVVCEVGFSATQLPNLRANLTTDRGAVT